MESSRRSRETSTDISHDEIRFIDIVTKLVVCVVFGMIAANWMARAGAAFVAIMRGVGNPLMQSLELFAAFATGFFYLATLLLMATQQRPVRRDRAISGWVLVVGAMVTMAAMGVRPVHDQPAAVLVIAGVTQILGGAAIIYALRYLGRSFDLTPNVRKLVVNGPYRLVRHPLYAAEMLAFLGVTLRVLSPVAIALFVATLWLQILRARREERALTAVYPAYRDYASRTPMLVPFANWRPASARTVTIESAGGD